MAEHDEQSSGVEAAANVQPSQGRRRWVKGAMLATPAVMTLMSGRLAARASGTACPAPDVTGVTGTPGTLSGYVYVGKRGNLHNLTWEIDPSDNSAIVLGYYKNNGDFVKVSQPTATSSCWASFITYPNNG